MRLSALDILSLMVTKPLPSLPHQDVLAGVCSWIHSGGVPDTICCYQQLVSLIQVPDLCKAVVQVILAPNLTLIRLRFD